MLKACERMLLGGGLLLAVSCHPGGEILEGLALRNPDDTGPTIVWDLEAESIPDIPFPNDVGTRSDRFSPTGRRVNVSREAPTDHETTLRTLVDRLDGFGTYAPIWLRFDDRLDIEDIFARQTDDDSSNDGIYLLNIDPESPSFGEPVPLDLGSGPPSFGGGRFPLGVESSPEFPEYFAMDPRRDAGNLLFETYAEDVNSNDRLDPGEDSDGDGVLDYPNLWGRILDDNRLMDPYRHLLSFYELETDTLIIRPIFPLDQLSTYAVIITRDVTGIETHSPVRSPFAAINHLQQTAALRPLVDDGALAGLGLDIADVAFTWSFTTQSITKDFEVIRAGLYGHGVMSELADDFPARIAEVRVLDNAGISPNPYILSVPTLVSALNEPVLLGLLNIPQEAADELAQSYLDHVDYFMFAEIDAPAMIHPDDGAFRIDWPSGRAEWQHETIYLNCAVPKLKGGRNPPYPVAMYNHGSGSTRLEILGFAAALAELGMAACAIDAFGHGLPNNEDIRFIAELITSQFEIDLTAMVDMAFSGRARDLNGDEIVDSGGDFWTANMVHTRDAVRQTVVDYFQVIRVMRAFGTTTMPVDIDGDGHLEIAGDFNADGIADFGGDTDYFMTGQSLGGIVTAVAGAVEPAYTAVAPVVAGAGLTDVAVRSLQPGMLEAIYLRVFGSLIFAERLDDQRFNLSFDMVDVLDERRIKFAEVPPRICETTCESLEPGDRVVVENLRNREISTMIVRSDIPIGGGFRLTVPTDLGDPLELRLYRPPDREPYRVINNFEFGGKIPAREFEIGQALEALQDGFGMRKGTPELRRLLAIAQMIVDPADPANYARYYHDPLPMIPDGPDPISILNVNSIGDMNVPISTGVAIGRIAGLIGQEPDAHYGVSEDQLLLDTWVVEGLEQLRRFEDAPCHFHPGEILFDIDDPAGDVAVAPGEPTFGRPRLATTAEPPECLGRLRPDHCAECEGREPLRATVETPWGVSGQRFLYQNSTGAHSFRLPDTSVPFDTARYQIRQIGWFFASRGQEIVDDPCLAEIAGCEFMRP